MPRHVDWEINIPLCTVASNEAAGKEEYFKIVNNAYLTTYCAALGVEPTLQHRALVARNAPLAECDIEATWKDGASRDLSSVANNLRVLQPQIGQTEYHDFQQDNLGRDQWLGQAHSISVAPPEDEKLNGAVQSTSMSPSSSQVLSPNLGASGRDRQTLFEAMRARDIQASEAADASLTLELDRLRRREQRRMGAATSSQIGAGSGRWELHTVELEALKKKFVLPFACERPAAKGKQGTVLIAWQDPLFQERSHIHVPDDLRAEASKPISVTLEQIEQEARTYISQRFPLELLTTRRDAELFDEIRDQLVSEEAVRLTGLLAHLIYWSCLGHLHKPAKQLPEQSRQSLLLSIQELWSSLQAPIRLRLGRRGELMARDGPAGVSFVLPSYMLAIKRAVEVVFLTQYIHVFLDPDCVSELIDHINLTFMNLFDLDCLYANFGALDATSEALKISRRLAIMRGSLGITPASRMIHQEYRTTPLMLLLMRSDGGNPTNPQTRKLLAKSSSDSAMHRHRGTEDLDGWRRATLYKTAHKRIHGLSRAGNEVVHGSPERARGVKKATIGFKDVDSTRSPSP